MNKGDKPKMNAFVHSQMKQCEALDYADLFKDYDEEKFKQITFQDLQSLPIDGNTCNRIFKHVVRLDLQQELSQISIPSSDVLNLNIVKKEEPTEKPIDENRYLPHDDEVEILFCSFVDKNGKDRNVGKSPVDECSAFTLEQAILMDVDPVENMNPEMDETCGQHSLLEETMELDTSNSNIVKTIDQNHQNTGISERNTTIDAVIPTNTSVAPCLAPENCDVLEQFPESNTESAGIVHRSSDQSSPLSVWEKVAVALTVAANKQHHKTTRCLWQPSVSSKITRPSIRDFFSLAKLSLTSSSMEHQVDISRLKRHLPSELKNELKSCDLVRFSILLKCILSVASKLKKITFAFKTAKELTLFLDSMLGIPKKSLQKLRIISRDGEAFVTHNHISQMAELSKEYLQCLETLIIDSEVGPSPDKAFDLLLFRLRRSLKHLTVTKSFIGKRSLGPLEIHFPVMYPLETLDFSSRYQLKEAHDNVDNLAIVDLENEGDFEEIRRKISVVLKFESEEFPCLKSIRMGCLIDVNLCLVNLPQLETFYVGSPWNLKNVFGQTRHVIKFPKITSLRFPDGIADPSFIEEVALRFPNLAKVKLQLPTIKCLQAFFQAFANSNVEKLMLAFNFDFEAGFTCTISGSPYRLTSESDIARLAKLQQYSGWKTFAKKYRIEIPDTASSTALISDEGMVGLSALSSMETFKLRYCSKDLCYPRDIVTNARTRTELTQEPFSLDQFPLGKEYFDEVLKLNDARLSDLSTDTCLVNKQAEEEFDRKAGWKYRRNDESTTKLVSISSTELKLSTIKTEDDDQEIIMHVG